MADARGALAVSRRPSMPTPGESFRDFVGTYRGIGIDEFIIFWWREDAFEYGYDRSVVERCADREMLEHLATETIPILKATA
jgi:hypothetical protein